MKVLIIDDSQMNVRMVSDLVKELGLVPVTASDGIEGLETFDRERPDLVVLDATVIVQPDAAGNLQLINGRANYESGHIPTARFADLMGELSDPDSPLQFGVPSPEQFAAAMGRLGVGDDSRVVLHDLPLDDVLGVRLIAWAAMDRLVPLARPARGKCFLSCSVSQYRTRVSDPRRVRTRGSTSPRGHLRAGVPDTADQGW